MPESAQLFLYSLKTAANEMLPVQGEIVVVGAILQNEFGSQGIVTRLYE